MHERCGGPGVLFRTREIAEIETPPLKDGCGSRILFRAGEIKAALDLLWVTCDCDRFKAGLELLRGFQLLQMRFDLGRQRTESRCPAPISSPRRVYNPGAGRFPSGDAIIAA